LSSHRASGIKCKGSFIVGDSYGTPLTNMNTTYARIKSDEKNDRGWLIYDHPWW